MIGENQNRYQLLKDGDNVLIIPSLRLKGVEFKDPSSSHLRVDTGLNEACFDKLHRSPQPDPFATSGQEEPAALPLDEQESMTAEDDLIRTDTLQWREARSPYESRQLFLR